MAVARSKSQRSSAPSSKAGKPSKKKQRVEVRSSESDVDEASAAEQGSSSSSEGNMSVYDDQDDEEDGVDEDSAPPDESTGGEEESDLDDDDGDTNEKKRKSPQKSAKNGKDDRNVRVVKKVKKIPGPREDPNTSVILPTTMEFLKELSKNNDRDWFAENDARYRHALQNWTSFVQAWVPLATEADWSLPHLPAKDLMQRIYRDVRFSKDKTPYKTHLGASHSRTGRKGPFALYYIHIGPHTSLIAGGCWQPSGDDTKKFRAMILDDPRPLREVLANKEFIKWFGEPDPKSGKRTSVYGQDDALKNCPKMEGVTKDHPDIDLLKLRTIAVAHYFSTEEVLSPTFLKDKVFECMKVLAPFVQLLNEILVPTPPSDDEEED